MALQFVAPHMEGSLTTSQLNAFYNIMKNAVWRVEIKRDERCKKNVVVGIYTGVCIGKNGVILTTYFEHRGAKVSVCGPSAESFEADLVYSERKYGLALVRIKHTCDYNYVEFSPERKFEVGRHVCAIAFPENASSSILLTGHLAYRYDPGFENTGLLAKYRTMGELPREAAYQNIGVPQNDLDRGISFLQIARLGAATEYQGRENRFLNQFGLEEGRGAPIFDITGRLLGLVALQFVGFDFAVHVGILREFFSSYMSSGGHGKEKVGTSYGKGKPTSKGSKRGM